MSEPKWMALSKSMWGTLLPLLGAVVASNPKLTGLDTLANGVVTGGLVIAGVIVEFIHQRKTGNTVLPKL